jgi:hypothetical protein
MCRLSTKMGNKYNQKYFGTPEEIKRQRMDQQNKAKRERIANMTPEEKKEYNANKARTQREREKMKSQEEKDAYNEAKREKRKNDPEYREKMNAPQRVANMTDEEKKKKLETAIKSNQKMLEQLELAMKDKEQTE